MIDFLNELNDVQRDAVTHIDGPSLVIAGAGSGKTRVLTYKIAYLLSQGMNARSILALTFTNKAAKEMKERIAKLVGHDLAKNLWMGTFHSIFSRILRIEANLLGYTSNFTIYDSSDSKSVIKAVMKELNLDESIYKISAVQGRISMAKNNLVTPAAYLANAALMEQDRSERKPRIADIYRLYCMRCKKADAMDFDDLLLFTNILFRDNPDTLHKYQQMFSFVLVDEYQDTNFAQYLIVNKIAALHKRVCVVGDDAQSIYSFRGAKIENILNFRNDYPGYRLHKLEQNYRSTKVIVNAANSIIAKNKGQIHKNVFSANDEGEKIKVLSNGNDHEEGFAIASMILDTHLRDQAPFSKFAILYRTNAQSRIFEESLRKRNIPYKVYGSLSFYQRKEIKDLLAYLRLTVNKNDDEALKRVINYPARGIGNVTVEKIELHAAKVSKSMWLSLEVPEVLAIDMNKGTLSKVETFRELINSFNQKLFNTDAFDLAMHIANASGMLKDLKAENSFESMARIENVQELLNSIKDFSDVNGNGNPVTLDKFLENVALLTDADTDKDEDREKVSMMTIHSSKGLEFDYVYLGGVEEDLFPSKMVLTSPQDLEEERRLFYVAITRAGKEAVISYASHRYKWGQPAICTPSRFIKDIDEKYLQLPSDMGDIEIEEEEPYDYDAPTFVQKTKPQGAYSSQSRQIERKPVIKKQPLPTVAPPMMKSSLIKMNRAEHRQPTMNDTFETDDPMQIKVGMRVLHVQFGLGVVSDIEGVMPNAKATVDFEGAGQRKLLLKFARLKIVG